MAIHAITNLLPFDYVPRQEQGSDNPTSFKLKPLNGLQHMEILREIDEQGRFTAQGLVLALRYGLIGWSNFNDEHGKAVPFNPANFGKVPPFVLHELAVEISNRSDLGEIERKN